VVNNLPGDVLRGLGAGVLVAVDVSSGRRLHAGDADGVPSPWRALWHRLRPPAGGPRLPTMVDVLERALQLTSTRQRRRVADDADLYLTPPVADFGLMQFGALARLEEIGYRYASERLAGWPAR
jgi:lysophospholipid hydrolase